MIVVDSSVWIANLRDDASVAVRKLRAVADQGVLLVGDLILLEVLQGARDDLHAASIERELRRFPIVRLLDGDAAARAARNYRLLRDKGRTVRTIADLVIGTFCIDHDHHLLHQDRDFAPMVDHLGLRVA